MPCPWAVSLGGCSLAALGCLWRSLDPLVHVEPDVSVPVRDHQFANLPAVVIGDVGDGEAGVRIAFQDFLPSVLAFGIELVVGQFDIDEGACVEFAADPHVEAGALEGVGRLALFFLGVALDADVLFPDPGALLCVPDVDITEQVPVDYFMGSLPVPRAEDLVKNPHIDAGVLVKQQDSADTACFRAADALNATFDVFFRQKGNVVPDGRWRVQGGLFGRLGGRFLICHDPAPFT